ncbi:hypothetical protein Agub_g7728, partial [Astrephomene gubernaculifera]
MLPRPQARQGVICCAVLFVIIAGLAQSFAAGAQGPYGYEYPSLPSQWGGNGPGYPTASPPPFLEEPNEAYGSSPPPGTYSLRPPLQPPTYRTSPTEPPSLSPPP